MALEYYWNDAERSVIHHLKALFPSPEDQRGIETRLMLDIMLFFQQLEKRPRPFFELWEIVQKNKYFTDTLGNDSTGVWDGYCSHWWITAFCQGAAAVFSGKDPLEKENFPCFDLVFDFFFSGRGTGTANVKIPHLPERMKEKRIMTAIAEKAPEKIIVLYDLARNPGEKMKNIFNILLNRRDYTTLMVLEKQYGLLEQIDRKVLWAHIISPVYDPGKKEFDDYLSQKGFKIDRELWEQMCLNRPFCSGIETFLKMGADPRWPLLQNELFSVPMERVWTWLYEFTPLLDWEDMEEQNRPFDWQFQRLYELTLTAKTYFQIRQQKGTLA